MILVISMLFSAISIICFFEGDTSNTTKRRHRAFAVGYLFWFLALLLFIIGLVQLV